MQELHTQFSVVRGHAALIGTLPTPSLCPMRRLSSPHSLALRVKILTITRTKFSSAASSHAEKVDANRITASASKPSTSSVAQKSPHILQQITLADFQKLDIRVAKIVRAEEVEGGKRVLRLHLDIGETAPDGSGPVLRQVLAGIKAKYSPEQLVGRHTLYLANLAPKQMSLGVSEGMVLAASAGTRQPDDVFLTSVDDGAQAGMKVS